MFPDAFGTMSLVWATIYGLAMLSDVGLASAILRDKRGDDPDFLNTAWTLQVIRGTALCLVAYLIAGPMSTIYKQPDLAYLIPVAGLTALIAGFNSTALITARRRMAIGRIVILELSIELVASAAMLLWAYNSPTVWALVGGSLISSMLMALGTHTLLPGIRNQFKFDMTCVRILIGFGKWIFLSSICTLLAVQGDRLLLGHYLNMSQLGVYSIAIILVEAIQAVVNKISTGVMFPAYGNLVQNNISRLPSAVSRARLGIDILLVVPIAAFMVLGSHVVELLYDERYRNAGWMLQILCLRPLMAATLTNSEVCLVALGHPKYAFYQNLCRAVWIVVGIPVGWHMMGMKGVVWIVALSELLPLGVLWAGMHRFRVFSLWCELRTLIFVGLGVLMGLGLLRLCA